MKPELFTHDLLCELEYATRLPIIRCYIALWCMTDRRALFEWKPFVLKQYCAPYDPIDFEHVLNVLANCGFVVKYVVAGRLYGWIPRFLDHQNINGREQESRLPLPPSSVIAEYEKRRLAFDFHTSRSDTLFAAPIVLGDGPVPPNTVYASSAPPVHYPEDGYVYYARDGKHVKIGTSKNPWARVKELRTARPHIALIAVEKGGASLEIQRHREFASARLHVEGAARTEWFLWTIAIETHVSSLTPVDDDRSAPNTPIDKQLATRDGREDHSSYDAPPPEQNRTEQSVTEQSTTLVDFVDDEPGEIIDGKCPDCGCDASAGSHASRCPRGTDPDGSKLDAAIAEVDAERAATSPGVSIEHSGKTRALPAIKGKRTAKAIVERLAVVLSEVHEGTRRRVSAAQMRELQAQFVFTYWANIHDHLLTLMDEKRLRRIVARLEESEGNVSELLYVVDGAKRDKHLMGDNERGTKYDGIETLFRDRAMVERLAEKMPKYKQGTPHAMMEKWASVVLAPAEP